MFTVTITIDVQRWLDRHDRLQARHQVYVGFSGDTGLKDFGDTVPGLVALVGLWVCGLGRCLVSGFYLAFVARPLARPLARCLLAVSFSPRSTLLSSCSDVSLAPLLLLVSSLALLLCFVLWLSHCGTGSSWRHSQALSGGDDVQRRCL